MYSLNNHTSQHQWSTELNRKPSFNNHCLSGATYASFFRDAKMVPAMS